MLLKGVLTFKGLVAKIVFEGVGGRVNMLLEGALALKGLVIEVVFKGIS
jgi:hypothetical protein